MTTPAWFADMLGWKAASSKAASRCIQLFGEARGPNLADLSNTSSTAIAGAAYERAGIPRLRTGADLGAEQPTDAAGAALERALELDILEGLIDVDAGRSWEVTRSGSVSQFGQYAHLAELQRLFETVPTLRSTVGRDYQVSTDVMVSLPDPFDMAAPRVLHAAISSKLTIRSDRVQNIRHEFGTLVRNRQGRLPHLVVVTAEPLPTRLLSIARGTGEIDAVYHLLFEELETVLRGPSLSAMTARAWQEQSTAWDELVSQRRIRPYGELAAVLAAG